MNFCCGIAQTMRWLGRSCLGLSWLGWPGLGLPGLAWACLPAALRAQADAAPLPAGPVAADTVRAVLQELDALFARGDVAGYLARFSPDHPGAHAMLQRRLERLVATAPARERTSVLLGEPRVVGPRTVVRVRHEVVLRREGHADAHFTEDSVLALRAGAAGGATPTFTVEIAPDSRAGEPDGVRGDKLRCPPCNYEVGGVPGWLGVPQRAERACAFEAISFYLIGTDVACDVSVRVDAEPQPATVVAQQLADALREVEPGARPGVAEAWQPCSLGPSLPPGFAGARVTVAVPDCAGDGGASAIFHVVTLGRLQHLLLARGGASSLRQHDQALADLLASYRLLDTGAHAADTAAEALAHHTGGRLEHGTYRNEHHRVELVGPAGWHSSQRPGGAAFRVLWSSSDGSRLWLTGQCVPSGMQRWCKGTAERWLRALCERHDLVVETDAPDSKPWHHAPECGALACTLIASAAGAGPPQKRWIRVLLLDQLLVIADGYAATAADESNLRAALATLRKP